MRSFDPAIDIDNSHPYLRTSRVQDSSGPPRVIPWPTFQPAQPLPQSIDAQYSALQHSINAHTPTRTAGGLEVRAEPYHGLPWQQLAWDPSSSGQAISAAAPTTPTLGSEGPNQEQSPSVAQADSPITVQGDGLPPHARLNSNASSDLQLGQGLLNAAQFASDSLHQPVVNGNLTQGTHNVSTFVQSYDPTNQYEMNPSRPMTLAQRLHFEGLGFRYPVPHDPFPMIDPALQEAERNALTNSSNCGCGPGCNCVFCAAHPYNEATISRVQELTQIMEADDYWSVNHVSPPQSGSGGAPTNGTNIESETEPEHPQPDEGYSSPETFAWTNTPVQDPALQPTFEEGVSLENGGHSSDSPFRMMRSSDYVNIEYVVHGNCTDRTGRCQCGRNCRCSGCLTHQGHTGLPN